VEEEEPACLLPAAGFHLLARLSTCLHRLLQAVGVPIRGLSLNLSQAERVSVDKKMFARPHKRMKPTTDTSTDNTIRVQTILYYSDEHTDDAAPRGGNMKRIM
jgi:hypothetical protein